MGNEEVPKRTEGKGFEAEGHRAEANFAYADLQAVLHAENMILEAIDRVLSSSSDRVAAEKLIIKEYAPKMDGAIKKSREALEKWLATLKADIGE